MFIILLWKVVVYKLSQLDDVLNVSSRGAARSHYFLRDGFHVLVHVIRNRPHIEVVILRGGKHQDPGLGTSFTVECCVSGYITTQNSFPQV